MSSNCPHHPDRGGGSVLPAYLGAVATRKQVPNGYYNNATFCNSRTAHFARDDITALKIVIPTFWVQTISSNPSGAGNAEVSAPTVNVRASVEYAHGSISPSFITAIPLSTIESSIGDDRRRRKLGKIQTALLGSIDPVSTPMVVSYAATSSWFATAASVFGNGIEIGSTGGSHKTQGGTIPVLAGTISFYPSAIVAMTKNVAVYLHGESRVWGIGDTTDASGDQGELARSIGGSYGYVNVAIPGDHANAYVASHTNRLALLAYCSHVISNAGINDIRSASFTLSQMQTTLQALWALFGSKPVDHSTIALAATSTDNFLTVANETTHASNPVRVAVNNWLRTKPSPLLGVFDTAPQFEDAGTSGKWKADGVTANLWRVGGLHASNYGYLQNKNSGAVNPAVLSRAA